MKKLQTSLITTGNGLPIKKGTLEFLQLAYQELGGASIISQIGIGYSNSVPYLLTGCQTSIVGLNTNISAGIIFYNNEMFIVPAQSVVTPTLPNMIVCGIIEVPYTTFADPVQMSGGGAPVNVHLSRQIQFTIGLTGTSEFDFSSIIKLGAWVDAGNVVSFICSGTGVVTVQTSDVKYNKYRFDGKTLHWQLQIQGATFATMGNSISIILPSTLQNYPFSTVGFLLNCGIYYNATSNIQLIGSTGNNSIGIDPLYIQIQKLDGTNFTNGTNNQNLFLDITVELN